MKSFAKVLLSVFASLIVFGLGAVPAEAQVYYGFNPSTGLEVSHGTDVSGGVLPVFSACTTISAAVGGAYAGQLVTSGTSCALVITFPSAAPNGWLCTLVDRTHAAIGVQASSTTTSCTFTAVTTTAADVMVWSALGY